MIAPWTAYPDEHAAAAACANHVRTLLDAALAGDSNATIAFSGGSSPKLMFAHLVRAGLDWTRVQIFQVDERAVPPDDPESNYRMLEEHLIQPARIPPRNIHRIHAELPPQQAARRYEEEIREVFRIERGELPHFDVIHLGVGADAHTASLFPGERLIADRTGMAAAVNVPKLGKWRITLLPGVLLGARHTVVLATGGDKAEALGKIFDSSSAPLECPAQMIAQHSRRARWFLDIAAAQLLDNERPGQR